MKFKNFFFFSFQKFQKKKKKKKPYYWSLHCILLYHSTYRSV